MSISEIGSGAFPAVKASTAQPPAAVTGGQSRNLASHRSGAAATGHFAAQLAQYFAPASANWSWKRTKRPTCG